MSNLLGNLRRSSSNRSINMMENDLKMVEENTSKFENQLNVSIDLSKIFAKNKYFLQSNLDKTRKFYEFMLVDTESIEISHVLQIFVIQNAKFSKCLLIKRGVSLLILTKCFQKILGQSPMITMIIWTFGTLLFIFIPLITHGSSIGWMK